MFSIPIFFTGSKRINTGFKDAWKHVTNGNSFYKTKGVFYNLAYEEYLKALVYNSSNPELNYKTGVSALFSDKKEEAAGFLLKAYDQKNDVAADILFLNFIFCVTHRFIQPKYNLFDCLSIFAV